MAISVCLEDVNQSYKFDTARSIRPIVKVDGYGAIKAKARTDKKPLKNHTFPSQPKSRRRRRKNLILALSEEVQKHSVKRKTPIKNTIKLIGAQTESNVGASSPRTFPRRARVR
jgi:hypothetical protein